MAKASVQIRGVTYIIEVLDDKDCCWRFPFKYSCGHEVVTRNGSPVVAKWKADHHRPCKLRGCKVQTEDYTLEWKCDRCAGLGRHVGWHEVSKLKLALKAMGMIIDTLAC